MNKEQKATTATGQPVISYKLNCPDIPTTSTFSTVDISSLSREVAVLNLITLDMRSDVETLMDEDNRYSKSAKNLAVIFLTERADAMQRHISTLTKLILQKPITEENQRSTNNGQS